MVELSNSPRVVGGTEHTPVEEQAAEAGEGAGSDVQAAHADAEVAEGVSLADAADDLEARAPEGELVVDEFVDEFAQESADATAEATVADEGSRDDTGDDTGEQAADAAQSNRPESQA